MGSDSSWGANGVGMWRSKLEKVLGILPGVHALRLLAMIARKGVRVK